MPAATILYMTGTGNTWSAVSAIAQRLSARGWAVESIEIRKGVKIPTGDFEGDLLILSFPVLAFGMPSLVRSVLRGLRGKGYDAAVFATWGGAATSSLWQAAGFLRRKGFRVVATGGAAYPFNWTQMLAPTDDATSRSMTKDGDAEARRFADALVRSAETGTVSVRKTPAAIILLGETVWWLYAVIGRFALGAVFAADERCTACGACARDCPAQAIVMTGRGGNRRPRWRTRCQGCNRCINMCPAAAIQSSPLRAVVHLTVNVALLILSVIGLNRLSASVAFPAYVSIPAWIVAFIMTVIYLSRLQFVALEPVLFALEGLPRLRRRIGKSWTAAFGRNSSAGFASRADKKFTPRR